MEAVTPRPMTVPGRPFALPNLLTYGRIAAVPAVVACMYWQDIWQGGIWLRWVALAIFISVHHTPYATASDSGSLVANIVRSATDLNWRQSPSSVLNSPGSNSATLDPCPPGVFAAEPWFKLASQFVDDWDMQSFDPQYDSRTLDHFAPLVMRRLTLP